MRGNPFMPQKTYRQGMYDDGSRSTSEVVGIGLRALKPIAQTVGSIYGGPAAGAAVGGGFDLLDRGLQMRDARDEELRRNVANAALYGSF